MSRKSIREHAAQLAKFAEDSEADTSNGPTAWLQPIVAKNQRAAAEEAMRAALVEEATESGELIEWRFVGARLHDGHMPLDFLAKLAGPLNNLLVRAAYFARTGREAMYQSADEVSREISLSLVGLVPGSTRLLIRGNTAIDATGVSALSTALGGVLSVLSSVTPKGAGEFFNHLDDIGERAAEALHDTLKAVEGEECSVELKWHLPGGGEQVAQLTYDRVVQMRALLDSVTGVEERRERVSGLVQLLSANGRIQVLTATGARVTVKYRPRSQAEFVSKLTLNAAVDLDVRVKIGRDPISGDEIRRYSLVPTDGPVLPDAVNGA